MKRIEDLEIENADVFRLNLGGNERTDSRGKVVNKGGTRNLCIRLDNEIAEQMRDEGWNVKILPPREDGDEAHYFISAEVRFRPMRPSIYLVSGNKKTLLDEDTIECLDNSRFKEVSLRIHPRVWVNDNGEEKIKAFLSEAYFVVNLSNIGRKFADYEE